MVRGQRVALLLEGLVPRHQPDAEFRCVNDGLETNTVYLLNNSLQQEADQFEN